MRKYAIFFFLFSFLKMACADFNSALNSFENEKYEKSLIEAMAAAENGDSDAKWLLGIIYRDGLGVRADFNEAVRWLNESGHDHGNPKALNELGTMLQIGIGYERNPEEAHRYFQMAASKGYPQAQANLGKQYRTGDGVPQNHLIAIKWYTLAADQGYAAAQTSLAWMYLEGIGVAADVDKAIELYKSAARNNYIDAIFGLGYVFSISEDVRKKRAGLALIEYSKIRGKDVAEKFSLRNNIKQLNFSKEDETEILNLIKKLTANAQIIDIIEGYVSIASESKEAPMQIIADSSQSENHVNQKSPQKSLTAFNDIFSWSGNVNDYLKFVFFAFIFVVVIYIIDLLTADSCPGCGEKKKLNRDRYVEQNFTRQGETGREELWARARITLTCQSCNHVWTKQETRRVG